MSFNDESFGLKPANSERKKKKEEPSVSRNSA